MYYIFSFSTRNAALRFYDILKAHSIKSSMINTPRQVRNSCGLSCKVYETDFDSAFNLINRDNSNYLLGVYKIDGEQVQRVSGAN